MAAAVPEEGKLEDDFKVEYAKSARSSCKVKST